MTTIFAILGIVIIAGGAVWFLARSARARGRAEVQLDAAKGALNAAEKGHAIDEEVAHLSDADLDDELRAGNHHD